VAGFRFRQDFEFVAQRKAPSRHFRRHGWIRHHRLDLVIDFYLNRLIVRHFPPFFLLYFLAA
jgi:hypothetical protein